jgi:T5SS/PEP-CTERM-associated repeat protein
MSGPSTTVSSQTELNAAIEALDQQTTPGSYTIKISGDITEGDPGQPAGIVAIDLASGVTLTIDGGGHVLNGAGANSGLAVLGGKVTISDLTIEDTVATGGDGDHSGGGGAGLGGGLFVGPGGNVVISNVQFANDSAVGGKGGAGGGGGGGGNSSVIYAQLGAKGATGASGTDGPDAETPFTTGGAGSTGSRGSAGEYGADGGGGGDGGKGGKGAAGTAGSNYTGGFGGPGAKGGVGGTGGPGGKGGDGGGGGDGGDGGDGTKPPSDWPKYAGAPEQGARGGNGAAGGAGGTGGGGAGGDGGAGGKGGGAPAANTAVSGKTGAYGAHGGNGGAGGLGGFGAGGGGGGNGGEGGEGGVGGDGGKGGKTQAKTGGVHVGGQAINITQSAGAVYPPGDGGDGGVGGNGGNGGAGGIGGFGGGGGGGGVAGAGGKGGAGGAGGTPGSSGLPPGQPGVDGQDGADGSGGVGGLAGFGGGLGAGGGDFGAGGGGLGAGGDIFVASGGVLVVEGGAMNGTATGGAAGGASASAGQGYGGSIFLQGDQSITLAGTDTQNLDVLNDITDEAAHGGLGHGSVIINGPQGDVVNFWSANDYTGGTEIESGNLVLRTSNALGSGVVDFSNAAPGTLTFNRTYAGTVAPGTPTNEIEGFAAGDTMIIYGIATTQDHFVNGVLTLDGLDHGTQVSITLNFLGAYATSDFSTIVTTFPDGTGSTVLRVDVPPPSTTFTFQGGSGDFATAASWLDSNNLPGVPDANSTTLFPNGGTLTGTGSAKLMDVTSATAFAGIFTTQQLLVENGGLTIGSGSLTAKLASLAADAGTTGDLDLTGAGSPFATTGDMTIGGAGAGSMEVAPGAGAQIGGDLTLGGDDQGSGALTLTGDGDNNRTASLTAAAIEIGAASSPVASQLTLNNQASLITGAAVIGEDKGAAGAAILNIGLSGLSLSGYAPSWTVNGNLIVGRYGSGALNENGSGPVQIYPTVTVTGLLDIGQFAGSTGVVNQTTANLYAQADLVVGDRGSGTLNGDYVSVTGNIDIGKNAGGVGVASFSGGAITTYNARFTVGGLGHGTLNLTNGALVYARTMEVGGGLGGVGTVSLDHGKINPYTLIVGNAGTGTVTVSTSGTIQTQAGLGGTHIIVGARGSGTLNIQSGGQVTTINSVDIGQLASGHGAILIDGAGSKLDAASEYSYAPKFTGALIDGDAGIGDLKLTNGGAAAFAGLSMIGAGNGATGTLEIQSGASASFITAFNLGFALGASGHATVTGSGSALTVTGAMNIGNGGSGELDILSGGAVSVANLSGGANYVALGGGAGASGVLLVDGAGSTFTIASDLTVGVGGNGQVTISNGGALTDSGGLGAGLASGVQSSFSILSGGSLSIGATFTLAQHAGSSATLTVGQGASVTAQTLNVGAAGGGVAAVAIGSGGSISVTSAEVFSGDSVTLTGGQLLTDPLTIDAGGSISGAGKITGDITNLGGVTASGGVLELTGNVGGALIIGQGATLQLDKSVASGATVLFSSDGGETLTLEKPDNFAASQIQGFRMQDSIHLVGFSYAGPSQITLGPTDVLSLAKTGGGTLNLTFTSNEIGGLFTLTSDGAGGEILTNNVSCFMTGTLIRTDKGEVAVEDLRPGDIVLTFDGGAAPVRWLGRQTVSRRFADPLRVTPIRVKAGALGEGSPRRDLLLSPDHALFVGGMLIQAGALVNGTSILREAEAPPVFVYYHVETADHALILAEDAPAETFIDNIDRLRFDNGAECERADVAVEMPYPRAKARRQVPAVLRAALERRAEALGFKATAAA